MKKTASVILAVMMIFALSLTAFAARDSFTPSVEAKGAPEIVPQEFNGALYDAFVLESGEIIKGLHIVDEEQPDGEIIVTAYSDIEVADPRVNVIYFEESYKEILSAQELQELNEAIPEGMLVRDFFDVTLVGTYENIFDEGKSLMVTFDTGIEAGANIKVLTRCSDETGWQFVNKVTNNGNGTVTVIFDELCPVIFLVDKDDDAVVTSPETSDVNAAAIWLSLAAIFGMISAAAFIGSKKIGFSK